MSKFQDRLLKHIEKNPDFIRPESRRNEIKSFVKDGLRDLSISRVNFSWGIPVKEDPKHVIYVWIDALANYLSAIGFLDENSDKKKYWPADFHVVGKDILRFHTVYWPAMLMSAGLELPKSIFAHGWWTVEGNKMSKSLGNAIDPNFLVEKFSVDAFRYFLMREVPFGLDGDFSYKALIHRINGDLANDLGNLLSRTLGMVERYFGGVIPEYKMSDELDVKIFSQINTMIDTFDVHINNLAFNKALTSLWEVISALNKYIDESAPWALAKDETKKDRLSSVLYTPLDALRIISYLVSPFMPTVAEEMRRQLTMSTKVEEITLEELKKVKKLVAGKKIEDVKAIFPRIDEIAMMAELQPKPKVEETVSAGELINFSDFEKVMIKAGKVLAGERVKKSDKLLKLSIDAGEGAKTIIAGIGKSYEPEELVGLTVAVVANLAPAKLMGIESNGMVLAVFDGERHNVIKLADEIKAGTRIK